MKRFLLFLALLLAVAIVVLFFISHERRIASAQSIASLLPADTAILIHIPDVEKSRNTWERTDLHQLYQEPTVQDFLRKPRQELAKGSDLAEAWRDSASLQMHDVFLATNTVDALRVIGGFEFRCGEKEARALIERWKDRWVGQSAERASITYGDYAIDTLTKPQFTMASVIARHRFFAANSTDDLKALLDRLDGHSKDQRLDSEEIFRAAMKEMPADYAALLYVQPKSFAQKVVKLRAQNGRALPAGQQTLMERIQSFSHAMVFEGGKLRDIDFVAMGRLSETKLSRETLAAASTDTVAYLALLLNLRPQFAIGTDSPFSSTGVTLEDWDAAFGEEMSLLIDWPAAARMPGGVVTLAVRDAGRAKSVARALASISGWESSTRDSVEYFTAPASGLAVMRLVGAVSDKRAAIGLDASSVERVISPPAEGTRLESAPAFREASRLVPEGQQMFAWLDLPALYGRMDSTLRPLLQISAAFMPDASSRFDVAKLPPADVVAKHLSPVVASQSYVDGGYRTESVGTITLGQTLLLGMGGYVGWQVFHKHESPRAFLKIPGKTASPTPTPVP